MTAPRPLIAIVGRPNVGKSSLFNRLVGRPIAIVDPTPGTTRDRLIHTVHRDAMCFDIIDTGGIGIVDERNLEQDIYRQVERAITAADRIIFMVDGRHGIAHLDQTIAERLRPLKAKVVLAVNKLDHDGIDHDAFQFMRLGLGEPMAISAAQGRSIDELLIHTLAGINAADDGSVAAADDGRLKVAVVGRRNVGKSSLTNALCGEDRVIVKDLPGTTRDAIDVPIDAPQGKFTLIDTAGLRKRAVMVEDDLEFYAACRTERAIMRADVVLLVLDASDEVGAVDKRIAHFCEVEGKPTVLVVNKWDIAQQAGKADPTTYLTWLHDRLPGLKHAPAVFTSAVTGLKIDDCLKLAVELHQECQMRISTSEVNRLLELAIERRRPKKMGPSPTKVYYGTQADGQPPTFVFFVNRTDWMEPGFTRFLEGWIRQRTPFARVPLRLLFKSRDSKYREHHDQYRVVQGRTKAERTATLVRRPNTKTRRYRRRDAGDDSAEHSEPGNPS